MIVHTTQRIDRMISEAALIEKLISAFTATMFGHQPVNGTEQDADKRSSGALPALNEATYELETRLERLRGQLETLFDMIQPQAETGTPNIPTPMTKLHKAAATIPSTAGIRHD